MAKSSPNRESDAVRIGRQTLPVANLIGIVSVLGVPTMAAALTCRAFEGGATFMLKFEKCRLLPSRQKGRKSATSSTTSTTNGINSAAAIASTSANGLSATASPSVTGMGGQDWIVSRPAGRRVAHAPFVIATKNEKKHRGQS
jgi:hypothetical protein